MQSGRSAFCCRRGTIGPTRAKHGGKGKGSAVTINVTANDSDPDGDTLTMTILTQPANGTATVSNGQIIYTPKVGFSGADSFTYRVSDGKGGNATATVTVSGSSTADQRIYLPVVRR